jgi:hypothetical protein
VTTSITSAVTASAMPGQCFNATLLSDGTRSAGFQGSPYCDNGAPIAPGGWFQFFGSGGMILANCVVASNLCGSQATGWYSGVFPATPGQTVSGTACFNWLGNTCLFSLPVQTTNCNGYYVFYLVPTPQCDWRYCTV